jgi:pheromone alpha factor receptor
MSNGAIPTPDPNSPEWSIYLDSQPFNLTALDGSQTTLTLSMINSFATYNQRTVAIQGFALGFSSLLIIVLLLLTTAKKAKRAIFIFNFLSLLFLSIRSIFNLAIACTDLYHGIGEAFLGATAQYSRADSAPSVVNALVSLFLTITVVTSLVLQVRVVFAAEPQTQKIITTVLSLFALWIVGTYAHYMALYIEVHLNIIQVPIPWTYKAYQISMIVFIGVSCLLFLYKLLIAIRLRKRMGYKNFGPLQILFIMFAQCLIIPGKHLDLNDKKLTMGYSDYIYS